MISHAHGRYCYLQLLALLHSYFWFGTIVLSISELAFKNGSNGPFLIKVVPPCTVRSQSVKIPAKHQTLVSLSNWWVRSSYYMGLKATNVCYNSTHIFRLLISIFYFNFNRKYSSPNCHSKSRQVGKSYTVLDSNLILSSLNDLDESIRFIETSNRPVGTLFELRNRAGNCASFAKSYRRYGVQMKKSTPKQWFQAKIRYLSGGSEVFWT